MNKKVAFNTKVIHGGQQPDKAYGAVMPPIYQTSTYAHSKPGMHQGYAYSRSGNPTRTALEDALASIESGTAAMVFGSGLAAIDAVMKLLKPGDVVLSTIDLYGGSYRLFKQVYEPFGIVFEFVDMTNPEKVEKAISTNTKLLWIETPTNPLLNIIDIEAMVTLAKRYDLLTAVDNTFASPYLQKPLELGVDIVMHSATKYLAGHSDVVLGALVVKEESLAKKLYFIQNASGAIAGPMDSFLTLRGIKTLAVRMQRHIENAKVIARFLQEHPKVEKVYWPGFASHPNHHIAKKQMIGFGAMLSLVLKNNTEKAAHQFLSNLKWFTLAESLGGVESLAGHPASMTHASIPQEMRVKIGVVDGLVRLSVGIEDQNDLIADLNQAL
ncbi:MAG: PLP-dependent aspartate aminotransferase family protein [Flavobacteriaceae bacterium]|nr:PLP-dependent aspartate aminotransferase family protein [Flavobacteriaceae bacterium]